MSDIKRKEYLDESKEEYPSSYLNEDKGYLELNHLNEEGLPIVKDMVETHNVSSINGTMQLTDIPDKFYGLTLEAQDKTKLTRVYNLDEIENTEHSYYIGRNNIIYCSHDLIGKYITVSYKGMGKILINCNMVYYRDKLNDVPVIIEDMLDKGQDALDLIATIGDIAQIMKKLKEEVAKAKEQEQSLSQKIQESEQSYNKLNPTVETANRVNSELEQKISNGNTLHSSLRNDIETGNSLHSSLSADNAEANRIQPILHEDVEEAQEFVKNYGDLGQLNNKINNKVDKVEGKGLSTNDYTTAEKNKLEGIAYNANNYMHPSSHPANMIVEDSTHKFMTQEEKDKVFSPVKNLTASSGYVKLASGLIVQWGNTTAGSPAKWVAFPIAFPNSTLTVQMTGVQGHYDMSINSQNTNGFEALSSNSNDFYYIAVGY